MVNKLYLRLQIYSKHLWFHFNWFYDKLTNNWHQKKVQWDSFTSICRGQNALTLKKCVHAFRESASSLASSMPSQILFKVFFKSLLLLYVHKSFSSSGSLLWFCVAFCLGSLYSPTTSAVCQPSTCGVSLAAQSGSSPSWPGSPAVGVCTSPLMPAGGAVRPGRWGQGPLYQAQTHREDKGDWKNMIIVRGDITHNFTQN